MSPQRRLLKESLRESAEDIQTREGLDRLAARLATKRLVLLGEASHGTADFYRVRRELSQRLIERHGFAGIVAEADWPDALRLTRYARDESEDASADEALETFQRFPTWMWRNTEVRQLIRWMRSFNASPQGTGAGFYGMDLYSLHLSMREVIRYLQGVDPAAAVRAQKRYACFDRFGDDAHQYGRAAAQGDEACEDQAVQQLLELQQRRLEVLNGTGADEHFYAEQNARLVQNAERYYRSMFRGRASSWNLRDTHMADTVDALLEHLGGSWAPPRLILWAHNSHLGDASATDMARPSFYTAGIAPDGTLLLAWLGTAPGKPQGALGTTHLNVAASKDRGTTFEVFAGVAADVCPCCRPAIVGDASGRWYLAWRAVSTGSVRDMVAAVSADRGQSWSDPVPVSADGWKINGCPHSGPVLQVAGNRLHIAWYSEAEGDGRTYWTRSPLESLAFEPRRLLSAGVKDGNHPVLASEGETVWAAFQGRDAQEREGWGAPSIYVRPLRDDAPPPLPAPRGTGSASHPELKSLGAGRWLVAWSVQGEENTQAVTARFRVEAGR